MQKVAEIRELVKMLPSNLWKALNLLRQCIRQISRAVFLGVPYTGRMHQIRVHLQWLGYPIVNDPIYNHISWGPNRGRGGVSEELVHKV